MSISESDIVTEARCWVGTRFHHQGRSKKTKTDKGGCDCIGLIVGVCDKLNIRINSKLVSQIDVVDYPRIPDGVQLQSMLENYLTPISIDSITVGDVLLFRFEKEPQHVAIVSDYPVSGELGIIHAYIQARSVVEHILDETWKKRIVAAYSFGMSSDIE